MKSITEVHNRKEVKSLLKSLFEKGYRYVVRDKDSDWLSCYTLKPKKYRDMESWGYVNPDEAGVKMAYPFKNQDVTEINWSNRSPKLIEELIAV